MHYVPCHHTSYYYVCITFPICTPVISTYALRSLSPHQLLLRMHYVPCHHTSNCYLCITFPITTQVISTYALRFLLPHQLLLRMHYVPCYEPGLLGLHYLPCHHTCFSTYELFSLSPHQIFQRMQRSLSQIHLLLRMNLFTRYLTYYCHIRIALTFTTPVISTYVLNSLSPHQLLLRLH